LGGAAVLAAGGALSLFRGGLTTTKSPEAPTTSVATASLGSAVPDPQPSSASPNPPVSVQSALAAPTAKPHPPSSPKTAPTTTTAKVAAKTSSPKRRRP